MSTYFRAECSPLPLTLPLKQGKLDPGYLHEIVKMFKELSNDGTEIPTQSVLEGELKYPTFYGVLKTLVC